FQELTVYVSLFPPPKWFFWLGKKFASDARDKFADIVATISRSYDKTDEVKFRHQTMISIFGMGTGLLLKEFNNGI
ncbi:MAG: hypothetical protein ACQES9_03685, partial [Myxococcota bacterium]